MIKSTLNNHLIIAMPHLNDTIFNQSVILINDYSTNGAMGFILNKPITSDNSNAILFSDITEKIKENIYFGGPVDLNSCFILHDASYVLNDSISISSDLFLTSNKKIIDDIINKKGPKEFMLNIGYSGWDSGQLEKEIKNGDWLILPNPKDFIFQIPDKEKWSHLIKKLGIDNQEDCISTGGQA